MEDYPKKILRTICFRCPKAMLLLIFVKDPYNLEMSIKDSERERSTFHRSHVKRTQNVVIKTNNKLPSRF